MDFSAFIPLALGAVTRWIVTLAGTYLATTSASPTDKTAIVGGITATIPLVWSLVQKKWFAHPTVVKAVDQAKGSLG